MTDPESPTARRRAPNAAVTITDVAEAAGVSKAAVSRFLSGKLELVSAVNRREIEATIDRLGYRPNRLARGLKRGRSRLIGFVVADVLNPYSIAVMDSAEKACRHNGYTMMLCNSSGDPETEKQILDALAAYSVEGIILHPTPERAGLEDFGLPPSVKAVLIDRHRSGAPYDFVGLDNRDAATRATRHLLENGFRDLAFVTEGLAGVSTRLDRSAATLEEIGRWDGARGRVVEVASITDEAEMDRELAAFAADGGHGGKAIVAGSGIVTLRVARAVARLGLRLRRDVGLVGFDEMEWSPLVGGGITTIAQPTEAIGEQLVRLLVDRIAGNLSPRHDTIYRGTLIIRGSSTRVDGSS